jgi:hypothetical protein
MRKIPGVPLIYVNVKQKGLGLEPMTEKSKQAMKLNEVEKVKPLDKDTARLKRALYTNHEEEAVQEKPKPKKRKVKGVNPLAMKKKKKKTPPPPKKKTDNANTEKKATNTNTEKKAKNAGTEKKANKNVSTENKVANTSTEKK